MKRFQRVGQFMRSTLWELNSHHLDYFVVSVLVANHCTIVKSERSTRWTARGMTLWPRYSLFPLQRVSQANYGGMTLLATRTQPLTLQREGYYTSLRPLPPPHYDTQQRTPNTNYNLEVAAEETARCSPTWKSPNLYSSWCMWLTGENKLLHLNITRWEVETIRVQHVCRMQQVGLFTLQNWSSKWPHIHSQQRMAVHKQKCLLVYLSARWPRCPISVIT